MPLCMCSCDTLSHHHITPNNKNNNNGNTEFVLFWLSIVAFLLHVYLWLLNPHKHVDLPPPTVISKSHCNSTAHALNPHYKSVIRERSFCFFSISLLNSHLRDTPASSHPTFICTQADIHQHSCLSLCESVSH